MAPGRVLSSRWRHRAGQPTCTADMKGTQTSVDEKLEIPRLDSSRGRRIAVLAGVLLVAAAIAAYFLMRDTEENPYRVA